MMAGASGDLELSKGSGKYHFPKGCPFCVLLREDYFKEFAAKLAERPEHNPRFSRHRLRRSVLRDGESGRQGQTVRPVVQVLPGQLQNQHGAQACGLSPRTFRTNAVLRLTEEIESARREIDRGRPQAVVLSSPTGSGKTVIMTLLMERLWAGHESIAPDPNAIFLWISDSPELNIQSKEKIEAASDVFPRSRLVVIDTILIANGLRLDYIYFLNTQKLGVSSLLTKPGDGRTWTIWQTIENTAKASPAHFNLIVDEAHRGMGLSAKAESNTRTLIQRFIKGAPEVGLSPVPLVIGMSATPERFHRVLEGAQRITRPVEVKAEDVRESGLIKDRIILDIAEEDQPADWTLLRDAGTADDSVRQGMEALLQGTGHRPTRRAGLGGSG